MPRKGEPELADDAVVVSNQARDIVSSWLAGSDDEDTQQRTEQTAEEEQGFEVRPSRLGLGAKFLSHNQVMSQSFGILDQRVKNRLQPKKKSRDAYASDSDEEESKSAATPKKEQQQDSDSDAEESKTRSLKKVTNQNRQRIESINQKRNSILATETPTPAESKKKQKKKNKTAVAAQQETTKTEAPAANVGISDFLKSGGGEQAAATAGWGDMSDDGDDQKSNPVPTPAPVAPAPAEPKPAAKKEKGKKPETAKPQDKKPVENSAAQAVKEQQPAKQVSEVRTPEVSENAAVGGKQIKKEGKKKANTVDLPAATVASQPTEKPLTEEVVQPTPTAAAAVEKQTKKKKVEKKKENETSDGVKAEESATAPSEPVPQPPAAEVAPAPTKKPEIPKKEVAKTLVDSDALLPPSRATKPGGSRILVHSEAEAEKMEESEILDDGEDENDWGSENGSDWENNWHEDLGGDDVDVEKNSQDSGEKDISEHEEGENEEEKQESESEKEDESLIEKEDDDKKTKRKKRILRDLKEKEKLAKMGASGNEGAPSRKKQKRDDRLQDTKLSDIVSRFTGFVSEKEEEEKKKKAEKLAAIVASAPRGTTKQPTDAKNPSGKFQKQNSDKKDVLSQFFALQDAEKPQDSGKSKKRGLPSKSTPHGDSSSQKKSGNAPALPANADFGAEDDLGEVVKSSQPANKRRKIGGR